MVTLYSKEDMLILEENIDKIIDSARKVTINKLEPTIDEYNKVMTIIKNYVSKNNRVIYGGYGWNELIIKKKPEDRIYSIDKIEMPDIEFYSPQPVIDLVNICNDLNNKGFKFVRGESAQHEETYSIYVNQLIYCDISYMPNIVIDKMPKQKINNLLISDPKWILIDIMRQYNDPMTSYWRVKKNLMRANILLSHYPLQTNGKFNKINTNPETNKALDFVRKEIIIGSKLLVFGYYGYQYYMYKANDDKKEELYVPYYDVISVNISDDSKMIYEKLKAFNDKIKVVEYHPFFQFMDSRISFELNGEVILNVYGNNEMCIPSYHIPKKDIHIVTFPYMIQTLLVNFMYNKTYKNYKEMETADHMLETLINARNDFLKRHKKSILDDTPFREFRINCMGETMDQARKFRLSIAEKIKNKQRIKFRYDPTAKNEKFVPGSYKFANSSGSINKTKYRILMI